MLICKSSFLLPLVMLALVAAGCRPDQMPTTDPPKAISGTPLPGTATPTTNEAAASTFDRVQKAGVIQVGYFPFEPTAVLPPGAERPSGLFIDLIEDIAKEMRWKVQYKRVELKNFAAALAAGEFDLSIGATFSSPGRAGGVQFSDPLFYLGYTGVTTADKAGQFKTWADVDQPGVRVAVKQGSAIADFVRVHFKNATVVSLEAPTLNAPLAAVPAQADVGLMNQITVFTFLRDNKDKWVGGQPLVEILADSPKEFTGICWAVRPGDQRWLEFVNSSIKHELDTGRFDSYLASYDVPYLYREKHTYSWRSRTGSGEVQR